MSTPPHQLPPGPLPSLPRPVIPLQAQPSRPSPGLPQSNPAAPLPVSTPPMQTDSGTIRQWEARVERLIRQGQRREEILWAMGEANWPFDQAMQMIQRRAARERWIALAIMAGTGVGALLGALLTYLEISDARSSRGNNQVGGAGISLIIFGIAGFIYGLVRLVKVRA